VRTVLIFAGIVLLVGATVIILAVMNYREMIAKIPEVDDEE
jgi:hypothetical protein